MWVHVFIWNKDFKAGFKRWETQMGHGWDTDVRTDNVTTMDKNLNWYLAKNPKKIQKRGVKEVDYHSRKIFGSDITCGNTTEWKIFLAQKSCGAKFVFG